MKLKSTNESARFRRNLAAVGLMSLLAMVAPCASGATYYVSTTGSDSSSGTEAAPFLTLSRGASAAVNPGDTVVVMDGTYGNGGVGYGSAVVTLRYSGKSGNPITFQAQHRGMAVLDGGSGGPSSNTRCNGASTYLNLENVSFIVIQGFVIQHGCDVGIESNSSNHDIVIKQNEIRNIGNWYITDQVGREAIYLNNSEFNFTFDSNSIHDIGRTGGNTAHFDHGIYTHAANLTIINNIFYNMKAGWSIQMADGASSYLIANNTFAAANTGDGEAGQIMWWGSNTNITVRNNIFYEPNSSAMTQYAATISGCVFDHNLVYPTGTIMSSTAGCSVTSNLTGSSANPQFVNASSFNFHTQPGGAGIDAGVNLSTVPYDYSGTPRPQGATTDIGAYEYAPTGSGPVISGVLASGISSNSATITWFTNQSSTSYVQYGPTSNYTSTTSTNASMVTNHSIGVSGLAASTTYHYRAASTNSSGVTSFSSDYTFTTAAVVAPPVSGAFAFSMSAASSSTRVAQGQPASDNITATVLSGTATMVRFTTSTLPAGVTATFSSPSCTPTCTTAMTFSTSSNSPVGTYSIVVTGSASGASATTTVALTVTAAGAGTGDITTGLAAQWKFTEGNGNYAYDSSGNGNTATLYNPTWWTSNYGMTCWFSGSNSYGAVTESSSLEMTNQLTIAFWVRPSQDSGTDPRVISKLYDWDVKLNLNSYPEFSAGGNYAQLNYALPLITWNHVVFTFNSGVVTGYVDGVQTPFTTNTFTASSSTLPNYAYNLYLAASDGSFDSPFIGSLDDVRIYNRALSATEVAALYRALN